jgi:hypothetical protein
VGLRVHLNVDAVDDWIRDLGSGAKIRLERDTTTLFPAPTLVASPPLVASQSAYEVYDATGTTSNYYRFRLQKLDDTQPTAWSEAFQGGAVNAYATLDSLREYLELPNDDRDNLLADLLVRASAWITERCGRDFYRHPQVSGTETRLYNGTGSHIGPRGRSLIEDIISVTSVRYAAFTGASYAALVSTDYYLEPATPRSGWPYEELVLSDVGTLTAIYEGYRTLEVVGAFGWSAVPEMIAMATLDLAREFYRQGPGGGGPVGVNQFGTPIFGGGMPMSVREVIQLYGRHFLAVV